MFERNTGLTALLDRPRPSALQLFLAQPCVFLASKLYAWRQVIPSQPISPIRVICISDTHNSQPEIPAGEILIHAGDLTQSGTLTELQTALDWLNSLPHGKKIVVAGNHDSLLDKGHPNADAFAIRWGDIIYLNNESVTLDCSGGRELKVYGSPLSPQHDSWAFQYPRTQDMWRGRVPVDTDILITHGPPKAHLDLGRLGCSFLLEELWRTKPRLHVFGHVHAGHGRESILFDGLQRAYEETVVAGGGVWNLGLVVYQFFVACFAPPIEARAILVNASMIGGLRDDERRRPVTVDL